MTTQEHETQPVLGAIAEEKPVLQRKALLRFQKTFAVLVAASIRELTETAFGLFYVRACIT